VDDVMTQNPITIHPSLTLHEALNIMERRQRQINVLAVVRDGECVGLVRLHDVVRANL
jgi:arabinose-5-phosphate isomerase